MGVTFVYNGYMIKSKEKDMSAVHMEQAENIVNLVEELCLSLIHI